MSDSNPNYINRFIISCLGLGFCLFAIISLYSFNVYDWPNPDVTSAQSIANRCGPIGAWLSYNSRYYLGPATEPILAAMTIWIVLYCMNKKVEQMFLRIIGVILFSASIAACTWLVCPGTPNSFSVGNGGLLGIALGHFLLTCTAKTGAILILSATIMVGLLLAADNILLLLPKFVVFLMDQLRQAGPLLAGVSNHTTKLKDKVKKTGLEAMQASTATLSRPSRKTKALEEAPEDFDVDNQPEESMVDAIEVVEEAEPAAEEEPQPRQPKPLQVNSHHPVEDKTQSGPAEPTISALAKMLSGRKRTSQKPEDTVPDYSNYKYPPADLLDNSTSNFSDLLKKNVNQRAATLQQTLKEFHLDTEVVSADTGPVITMFELMLAPGIKVSKISSLANDLARSLGAPAVRVVAPLPGRHTIGIEVPNSQKETVRIKELLQLAGDKPGKMQIPLFLGKDASGQPLIEDLTAMPHCLIAGTTGSGKSVCINSIITSILLSQRPDMVKMILIDPKMVEMNAFANISHLMCPIVTEMQRAEQILSWLTTKMDERYALLAEAQVRNIVSYNKLTEEELMDRFKPSNEEERMKIPMKLPYIVVIIDELADLMMTSAKEVEGYIVRLAQKSRAVGIHLVLATQRPQATVVTGLIKSNMPCRISFRVASRMDSRIVLDSNGAETLLGQGDMLFLKPGSSDLMRAQGTYMSDNEINRVVKYLKEVSQPSFHPELMQLNTLEAADGPRDEMFDEAVRIILATKRGSVSLLQRRLTIGYSRASRLVDQMAAAGIVGEYKGSQARDVLMTLEEYESVRRQMSQDAVSGYTDLAEQEEDMNGGPVIVPVDDSEERFVARALAEEADKDEPNASAGSAENAGKPYITRPAKGFEPVDTSKYLIPAKPNADIQDVVDQDESADVDDSENEDDEGLVHYEYVDEEDEGDDEDEDDVNPTKPRR